MSVTIAKRGEANLVSHIPAKSSHGAANSRVMRLKARPRGSERPTTTRDKAAAKIPYIGTCTWVSWIDRKSTRLNSSHGYISYAVFCLKKKKKGTQRCI